MWIKVLNVLSISSTTAEKGKPVKESVLAKEANHGNSM